MWLGWNSSWSMKTSVFRLKRDFKSFSPKYLQSNNQYKIVMLGKLWPTLSVWTVKSGVSIIDRVRFLVCLSSVILIGHDHTLFLYHFLSVWEKWLNWVPCNNASKFGWDHKFEWVSGRRLFFFVPLISKNYSSTLDFNHPMQFSDKQLD